MVDAFKAYTITSSIFGSCGVIFNFFICLLYFKKPHLLDALNIFILNIAVSDFLQATVATPLLVLSNTRGEWLFGESGCTGYGFTTALFGLSSMMHLAGVAYERYFTFCKLLDGNETQFSKKKAIALSIMLWCYSFFWSLMPVIGWSSYTQEGVGTSCAINWRSKEATNVSFSLCLILACFILPVTVIVYCYYKSYKLFYQYALHNGGNNTHADQQVFEEERKMAWITVAMTAGFLSAWTPYALSSIVAMVKPTLISDSTASIPAYIAKSSFCYSPIIYAFMSKKLRRNLVDTFCLYCNTVQVHPHPTVAVLNQ